MNKKIVKNIISLYGFSFAKIILPLITLPYLTRVLSIDSYGVVAYTKSVIGYFQLFVDFGFLLSGTKKIVTFQGKKQEINKLMGNILIAKLFLVIIAIPVLIILSLYIPIFKGYEFYLYLSFVPVILTIFLFDYVFRGIEKMHLLTIRFFIMKGISTTLTFAFVHNDADILWIPILDIIGSLIAIVFVVVEIRKEGLRLKITKLKNIVNELRDSAVFFVSNMAQTVFSALNTVVIGIFLDKSDVAFWSLCIQMVTAIQTMYQPITDGIYPQMVATKDLNIVKRIVKIIMPIITVGCIFTLMVSRYALLIVGGAKYTVAEDILRTATFQLFSLLLLGAMGIFNLMTIAICRSITEIILCAIRFLFLFRYRSEFKRST